MSTHPDKYQADAAYKDGIDNFTKIMRDFTDIVARLDKPEVQVRCAGCKTEKMVSKVAIKESVVRCKCGGFMIAVK